MKFPMLLCLILLYYFLNVVDGLKVLVCYPLPVKSVSILGHGVVRNLLEAGHEVTYMTVYPLKNPPTKNFRQIDISSNTALVAGDQMLSIEYILNNKLEKTSSRDIQLFGQEAARMTLNHENVIKLIEDPNEHFDVILTDLLESELYSGFAVVYECPMIWVYSMGAHWQVLRMIDVATSPAYDPDYLSSNTNPLSFTERVDELWTRIQWQFFKTFFTQPEERRIYEAVFGPVLAKRGRTLPDYEDVIYNASLIFGNEHDAVRNRPSTPQNVKYIGGIHIEEPVTPLPKDLQDLIDNSKHGVIYFSMGSFLQSKTLPRKLIMELLQMFGEFKQTVIWKFEDNSLQDVPKNVHIVNWAPQPSILAHPNVKMFLTHGGLFSSIEAVHFGVPTIGIPVLFDQITNVNKAVLNGYALKVELSHNLAKDLKAAINVVLSDDRYTKKAKELSAIYHDRLTKPGLALAYWVEHVVRTRGALHLRSPALHVPLHQRLYLDLLVIILTTTFALVFLLRRLCQKRNGIAYYDQKKSN